MDLYRVETFFYTFHKLSKQYTDILSKNAERLNELCKEYAMEIEIKYQLVLY